MTAFGDALCTLAMLAVVDSAQRFSVIVDRWATMVSATRVLP